MLRHQSKRAVITATLVLLTLSQPVVYAATVAPHAVFMDHRTRAGVFYVQNPGLEPIEVEVSLQFGYPASDDQGTVRVTLMDDPEPSEPSAAAWVRALPRRLVVPPGERQAVRLLARPPAGLPDGEYWSRIIVASKDHTPIREASGSNVSVGLELVTRTIISLNYRKGDAHTGVQMTGFTVEAGESGLVAQIDMTRTGNAAFLGRLELRVLDAAGAVVDTWDRSVAVYHDLRRRIVLGENALPTGVYRVLLRLSTDRQDIDPVHVLPVPPIEETRVVTIGASR